MHCIWQSLIDRDLHRLSSLSNLRELSLRGDNTLNGIGLTALRAFRHLQVINPHSRSP